MAYDFNNDGLTVPVVEHPDNIGVYAHDLRVLVVGGRSTEIRKGVEEAAPDRTSSGLRRYLFYVSYAALTALGSGRTFGIAVRTITGDGGVGDWAVMPDAFNPPPPAPELTYTATVNSATVYINRPDGLPRDYKCSVVHVSSNPNYNPATGTPTHAEWNGDVIPVACPDAAINYVWIADQDSFGPDGLLYSDRLTVQRLDPESIVDFDAFRDEVDDLKTELIDATDENGAGWTAHANNLVTGAIAGVRTAVTAVATDLAAETNSRTVAISTLADSTSASINTLTTKATDLEASATATNLLVSQQGQNIALHDQRLTTNADDISAEVTARTTLATQVGNNQTAITTEMTNRTNADSALGTRIDTVVSVANGNVTAITNEATTRANQDTALALQITTLSTTVGNNLASLQQADTANANATSAVAGRAVTLEAKMAGTEPSGLSASITEARNVAIDAQGKANATWGLTSNVNGLVSGIQSQNNGAISRLDFMASRIRFMNDAGTVAVAPLEIVNGRVRLTNAEVSGDLLVGGTITNAKLAESAVTGIQAAYNSGTMNLNGTSPTRVHGLWLNVEKSNSPVDIDFNSWATFTHNPGGSFTAYVQLVRSRSDTGGSVLCTVPIYGSGMANDTWQGAVPIKYLDQPNEAGSWHYYVQMFFNVGNMSVQSVTARYGKVTELKNNTIALGSGTGSGSGAGSGGGGSGGGGSTDPGNPTNPGGGGDIPQTVE